jgi:hypothetical protein
MRGGSGDNGPALFVFVRRLRRLTQIESVGKRCRAEYRLPPHSKDAAAGTEGFGTPRQPFWSAVASGIPRDTALRAD